MIVEEIVVVTAVVGWDTKPVVDVTGTEFVEEAEKYFEEITDISADELDEELVAALLPAWYLAARSLSLACLLRLFLFLEGEEVWRGMYGWNLGGRWPASG